MGLESFIAERDWTGLLALLWVSGVLTMLGWTVYTFNIELFREIIVGLLAPTVLILKYYYDKQDQPE